MVNEMTTSQKAAAVQLYQQQMANTEVSRGYMTPCQIILSDGLPPHSFGKTGLPMFSLNFQVL